LLLLRPAGTEISYGVFPERKVFHPEDYTLAAALTRDSFDKALLHWRDQSYALWTAAPIDEDLAIAYGSEALRQGTYKAVIAAVSPALASQGGYGPSVYFGRLSGALRSISQAEGERYSRLSRLVNEKSTDFFLESHGLEGFVLRGAASLIDGAGALARSLDPAALDAGWISGILEGFTDWARYRPGRENPFGEPAAGVLALIAGDLWQSPGGDRVLFFHERRAETEFNLRLGKALTAWAESAGDDSWAAVGRSVILSALASQDAAGTLPGALYLSASGEFTEVPEVPRIGSARVWRLLEPGDYYPHAEAFSAGRNGFWIWTAAAGVSVSEEGADLNIAVSFPVGESHYMLIRGIRPFVKIQLHGIDFRSDAQFERYDSSGWTYSTAEQTLLLKLKHRSSQEHIRIVYTLPPPPPVETESVPAGTVPAETPETVSTPPRAL
jgi:hypothetical protein